MKILFVGLGGVGQRHLRNIYEIFEKDDIEIYAYRNINKDHIINNKLEIENDSGLEEKYNIQKIYNIDENSLKHINAVFICNPTSMHMDILVQAIKCNCNIFIEKPISDNLDNIEELNELIKNSNSKIFVGYQNRFHPCIERAKCIIDGGILGNIISVHVEVGELVKNWHKYENYKDMYACRKELGGGVVLSQIHEIDYLYYIFGMPKTVYAIQGGKSNLDIGVEDCVDALMKYNNFSIHLHQDYIQNPPSRKCKIIGSNGIMEFDLLNASYVVSGDDFYCTYGTNIDRNELFISEIRSFFDSIMNDKEIKIPIKDGINGLKIALAIKKSIETEKVILLEN